MMVFEQGVSGIQAEGPSCPCPGVGDGTTVSPHPSSYVNLEIKLLCPGHKSMLAASDHPILLRVLAHTLEF